MKSILFGMAATCDIAAELKEALNDEKIIVSEALAIGELCVSKGIAKSTNPFAKGQVKKELNYIRNNGIIM